jgi:hypothetical protein
MCGQGKTPGQRGIEAAQRVFYKSFACDWEQLQRLLQLHLQRFPGMNAEVSHATG